MIHQQHHLHNQQTKIPNAIPTNAASRFRSMTPSPKKSKFTDPKRTTQLVKRLISRCCMLQKLKIHLEECLQKSERQWEQVVGTEHIGWESESFIMELCDELNPLAHYSDINRYMNEMVHIENEVLNVLDDIVECVCTCIRNYSKKYSQMEYQQQHLQHCQSSCALREQERRELEAMSNRNFFKQIVNSPSFQNSLQEKVGGVELLSEWMSSPSRTNKLNLLDHSLSISTSADSNSDERLLQLKRRSKIVRSAASIMQEIVGSVESPLLKKKKMDLEDLFDKLCQKVNQHQAVCDTVSSGGNPPKLDNQQHHYSQQQQQLPQRSGLHSSLLDDSSVFLY
jgi:hypothetical protein